MTTSPDPATVARVDLPRYMGTWYEIARLPMRHEPEDATDITANYALQDDGKVEVRNRMRHQGEIEESVGEATAVDETGSKLVVSFLPEGLRWIPFTKGDYWVLALDEGYTVALVGSPDRKYLWLLSREPQLDEATRTHYLAIAEKQGFDLSPLIHTAHTSHRPA